MTQKAVPGADTNQRRVDEEGPADPSERSDMAAVAHVGQAARTNASPLERLRSIRDGREPCPALYETLGIRVVEADLGAVMLELLPSEKHRNPWGVVGGGVIATILDTATGWACDTLSPQGSVCTTVDLKVNFLRPVQTNDGAVTATATAIHSGTRIMVAEGKLFRTDGQLLAIATATCLVVPLR